MLIQRMADWLDNMYFRKNRVLAMSSEPAYIHTAESVLQSLDDRIREMEGQLSHPGTPKERREVLLIRLQNMQADRRSERDRLERMQYRAAEVVGR